MKKPYSLREHLLARLPSLNTDPERLIVLVENGRVAVTGSAPISLKDPQDITTAVGTAPLSFMYRSRLVVAVLDYNGTPSDITASVIEWLRTHQPDLFDNPDFQQNGIGLEVEPTSSSLVDMTITLDGITESIVVGEGEQKQYADITKTNDVNNVYRITPLDEPQRDDLLGLF